MPLDALEYVVRPYVTPDAHGRLIIPSAPRGTRERATLTWGQPITMPSVEEVSGVNFEVVCCKDQIHEASRKFDPRRVFQRDDPTSENWVDLERPYQLELTKKEKNTCGDNWDDISGVAAAVDAAIAEFDALIHSGTAARPDRNCAEQWNFSRK